MTLNPLSYEETHAVQYHYDEFPLSNLDYAVIATPLAKASEMLGRYDQMLKTLHNSALLLAPLRKQEAVV